MSESGSKSLKVAVCDVIRSESSAGVVDSEGTCLRPSGMVVHDTTTNPGHPNVYDEDRVGDACPENGPSGQICTDTSPLSSIPHITDVDSCDISTNQGINTKTFASTPSHLLGLYKNKTNSVQMNPNKYTISAIVAGINATRVNVSDASGTISVADPR